MNEMLKTKIRSGIMKTAIGYKLFRVSKKYPGKLFPLYVNANTNIPIGE